MQTENVNLTNNEWSVLECLWASAPKTVMQLVNLQKERMGWAKSTTTTMITRMEAKGLIYCVSGGKARLYYPNVNREAAVYVETTSFLNKVYQGSIGMMMNTLVEKSTLSKEEIQELYKILQKAEDPS